MILFVLTFELTTFSYQQSRNRERSSLKMAAPAKKGRFRLRNTDAKLSIFIVLQKRPNLLKS